ncbi:MAG: hypothetical protein K0R54_3039 [Clostridiaceae bacterium]|jgi:hypothetical protein|nr:hypothetical protein [Clostridiaceae bacterium]
MSIILLALLGVLLLVQYFKYKKIYMLLAIIPVLFAILFQTPLINSISKTLSNILAGILILFLIFIFGLSIKDDRDHNK